MSVEIYGADPEAGDFPTIAVAGEASFNTIWQLAIDALGLKHIGNMRWLRRADLPEILEELGRLAEAPLPALPAAERERLGRGAAGLRRELAERWEACPHAARLWMG